MDFRFPRNLPINFQIISKYTTIQITHGDTNIISSQAHLAPNNRSPRATALWDKWRHVCVMAWERDKRLKEKMDWAERVPLTNAERTDDEINHQVALCNCRQKFKVLQVGVEKYRVSHLKITFIMHFSGKNT